MYRFNGLDVVTLSKNTILVTEWMYRSICMAMYLEKNTEHIQFFSLTIHYEVSKSDNSIVSLKEPNSYIDV